MKAFLLGGGLGTRLQPITRQIPKCLVEIGGRPLISHLLALCARAGIDHVLLNVSSHHAAPVRAYLNNEPPPIAVALVEEEQPLGNAGTVSANRAFVAGESSFCILHADNFTNTDLTRLLSFHATHAGILTMGLFEPPHPEQAGIVRLESDGLIVDFQEKPAAPASRLANAGIYVARPALMTAIAEREGVIDFGTDVLPALIGQMFGRRIDGYLTDIGTPEGLAAARGWADVVGSGRS